MAATAGIGGGAAGLWYRVQAVSAGCLGGSAAADYASVLPAVLNAARHRMPFIAGWLSRGGGAPLELITNAGPLPVARHHEPGGDAAADDAASGRSGNGASRGNVTSNGDRPRSRNRPLTRNPTPRPTAPSHP